MIKLGMDIFRLAQYRAEYISDTGGKRGKIYKKNRGSK